MSSKKFSYTEDTSKAYASLGIKGTTYEPTFNLATNVIGKLENKVVLDFGSGAGRSAQFLLHLGAKMVIGVDHNSEMINRASNLELENAQFILLKERQSLGVN